MSQTKEKKFTGFIGWNHLVDPDDYLGVRKWKLDFYPDDWESMKDMGCKLRPKTDEKGSFVRPTRDTEKIFTKDGVEKLTQFTPPKIVLENGEPFEMKYIPKGSRVEVNLVFYNAGKFGTGTRLQDVRILELAEEVSITDNQAIEAQEEVSTVEPKEPKAKKLPF